MKYATTLFASMIAGLAFAGTPPAAVLSAFKEKFPAATNTKWDRETKNEWEAEFRLDGQPLSANFSEKGLWMETETTVLIADLPENVRKSVHTIYPKAEIRGCSRIESQNTAVLFEVEMKSGLIGKEHMFDESGKEVK